ncbi:MAG: helix-turn-helix transcriptional regulator [Bullifex sp.]|nr:helix-turn-helix transcriptional regulator [Bullifex sp.]
MAVTYNRLWKLLIDRKLSRSQLRKEANISPNTMTKLNKDEMVALAVLDRICNVLDVDYGDIMQHVNQKVQIEE